MACTPSFPLQYGNILAVLSTDRPTGIDRYPGRHIFETDTFRTLYWDGTGWTIIAEPPITTYVPVISQGATPSIAKTVALSEYTRSNGLLRWSFDLNLTAGGTAGSPVSVNLPIAGAWTGSANVGAGMFFDASTGTRYISSLELSGGGTTVVFPHDGSGGAAWGALPNLAAATGDVLRGSIEYRMTSRYS